MTLTLSVLEQAQTLAEGAQYARAWQILEGYVPLDEEQGPYLRTLGWLSLQLGESELGVSQLERAVQGTCGLERAKSLVTLGAALDRLGRWERALSCQREALALFGGQPLWEAQTLCNLGALELRRVKLEDAERYFGLAHSLTRRRKEAAALRPRVLLGLSGVARVSGQFESALYRASQALNLPLIQEEQLLALRLKAAAQRGLGQYTRAQDTLHGALAQGPQGLSGVILCAHLGYAELQDGLLELAQSRLHGLDSKLPLSQQCGWWLFQAELERRRHKEGQAFKALEQALSLSDPFSLLDEARGLSGLFAWGRARGLDLPTVTPTPRPTVQLETLGRGGVRFTGRSLALSGTRRALPLLTYLTLEGASHWEQVADAILEPSNTVTQYRTLNRTVSHVRDLLGSRDALKLEGGILTLSPQWYWECDAGSAAQRKNFLPGLHTEWAEGIRETAGNSL